MEEGSLASFQDDKGNLFHQSDKLHSDVPDRKHTHKEAA